MTKINILGKDAKEMKLIVDKIYNGHVIVEDGKAFWTDESDDIAKLLNKDKKELKKDVKQSSVEKTGKSLLRMGDEIGEILIGRSRF